MPQSNGEAPVSAAHVLAVHHRMAAASSPPAPDRQLPGGLAARWKRRWRRHVTHVRNPVGFTEAAMPIPSDGAAPLLRWKKYRLRSFVVVLTDWRLCLRRVRLAPCATAATAFIKPSAAEPYRRQAPHVVGAPPALDGLRAARLAAGPVIPPAGGLAVFQDATVAASGVVLTADGRVVGESLVNSELWSAFGAFVRDTADAPLQMKTFPLAVQKRLSGAPHVMVKQTYDANYGHWLIECLPRLAAVAEHFDLAACKFIVSDGHGAMQQIYADTLAVFGIRPAQIVALNYAPVHVDLLVYPLPITRHPWIKSPKAVQVLEAVPAHFAGAKTGPKRVYVSRNRGTTRRLLNEAAVIDIVQRHGFTVVYPETMAFADQVRAFAGAEIVVGNYGANLSNVVFSPRGATLFALTTEFMQDDFFWDLMDHKGGAYVSLHGTAQGTPGCHHADFIIDLALFAPMLEDCLRRRPASP